MKLHSISWAICPVVIFILVWAVAGTSHAAAEAIVETGLLAAADSTVIPLPAAHGAGLGVSSLIIYTGIGFVVGPVVSLFTALDFVWDDKNMELSDDHHSAYGE